MGIWSFHAVSTRQIVPGTMDGSFLPLNGSPHLRRCIEIWKNKNQNQDALIFAQLLGSAGS